MDAERIRAYLLTLPHAVETMQWGATLVFWTCDKSIGGKMFAILNFNEPSPGAPSKLRWGGIAESHLPSRKPHRILSYAAGPERFPDLIELDGLSPAPYLARAHWIAADRWDAFTPAEWRSELAAAHTLITAKLPPRTRKALALPPAELKRLIAARRKHLTKR
jgi:predicted DNA-binding protein (MmcQ/YjbR family)